jgi:hypothetical protein
MRIPKDLTAGFEVGLLGTLLQARARESNTSAVIA